MDELDLSKIKTSEVVAEAEEETEDWELVSKFEAGVEAPYISFPKMHEIDEKADSLFYKTSTESDRQKQGAYPKLNQESGRGTRRKQESVRRKEIKAVRVMDEDSQSKPLILEQKDAGIVKKKEGVHQKFSPRRLGQEKASARKVETVEGLEDLLQKEQINEMLRKQFVVSLKQISKQDPESEKLRRELIRSLRYDEYDPKNEMIRKIVEILRDVSPRDRENGRWRREMIEALQDSPQSDQGNERSNLEMVEVPKEKVETVEGLEDLLQKEQINEMLRKQFVVSLKQISKQDPESEKLKREIIRSLRYDEYDPKNEMIRKIVKTLRDVTPRDRENGRFRREMIEALQDSPQSDQGNETSNLEMVEVTKDVSQCDKKSEWIRREIMEAMQGELFYDQESEKFKREMVEVPTAAPKYVQGSKKEGRCIVLAQKDGLTHEREWLRKEWIEAMQGELKTSDLEDELPGKETVEAPKAASKNDQGSESLGREIIEALKEKSQFDKERELLKREVVEAMQESSHYKQENERLRREIREAKRIAAQFEEENERVKRVIDEAMQDLSQSITKPESELSQSEKEKEMSEIATNERFARDLKLREIKSFTWQEPESAPVKSSFTAAVCKDVPEKLFSQNLNQARQGNTSTQSKTPSKLQIKDTGNESSPKRAIDSDLVELFSHYFKCNLKVSDEVTTESENSDGEKDFRVKISKDSVSFKNEDSPSSDTDESKKDCTNENN